MKNDRIPVCKTIIIIVNFILIESDLYHRSVLGFKETLSWTVNVMQHCTPCNLYPEFMDKFCSPLSPTY